MIKACLRMACVALLAVTLVGCISIHRQARCTSCTAAQCASCAQAPQ